MLNAFFFYAPCFIAIKSVWIACFIAIIIIIIIIIIIKTLHAIRRAGYTF